MKKRYFKSGSRKRIGIKTIVIALAVMFAITGLAVAQEIIPTANISGMKFNDLNGNGIKDPGEPGLANWTIELSQPGEEFPPTTLTDSNGNYTFTGLTPGNYTVGEVLQPGWRQTAPKGGIYNVTLNGTDITGLDFGNENTSQIISVGKPVAPNVLVADLRTLPIGKPWKIGDPIVSSPEQEESVSNITISAETLVTAKTTTGSNTKSSNDPALSNPINNLLGIPFTGIVPPDTIGDVGPNHYIQAVNWGTMTNTGLIIDTRFAILDKSGNVLVGNDNTGTLVGLNLSELWIAQGQSNSNCGNQLQPGNMTVGDPIVKYDHLADRWILGQLTYDGLLANGFCLAVSRGPNPVTDGWNLYNFPSTNFQNDYPKLGVWPDAYYVGTNDGYPGAGGHAWAFDRTNMLAGNVANEPQAVHTTEFMLPSDSDGPAPPPSAPNIFVRFVDGAQTGIAGGGSDRLEMRAFHADFTNPALSTFNNLPDLNTAAFNTQFCNMFGLSNVCISQPGAARSLVINRAWPLYRLQYRNFGTYETLVLSHSDNVGNNVAGERWYELHNISGTWQIAQQGTYSPDSVSRWMGSIAMDKDGNLALGYSVSNDSVNPGIRYTGRLAGDPSGTLPQGELSLIEGGSAQTNPPLNPLNDQIYRWGDYTAMGVDPKDDCTFWYTNEYYPSSNAGGWRTRIGSFGYCSVISGTKFNDINGNGIKVPGDPGIAGWQIDLNYTNGTVYKATTTDSNGNYNFTGVALGNYILQEVLKPGWIQTAPAVSTTGSATYAVNFSTGGQNLTGKDFGNFKLGEVHGQKFEDLNANGIKEDNETGLAGWNITINGTDTITGQQVNLITTTDANGNYNFTGLTAGTYTISETLKTGWVQTAPSTGTYTVNITSGSNITGQDFGNFHKGKITGGGWIEIAGGRATFGIVGQYPDSSNTAQGNVEYQDHIANLNIKSIQINTSATALDKKKGAITGLAQVNGVGSYPFVVYVEDNAETGKDADVFKISLPTYPYSNGAILSGGNIQIHS